MDRFRSVKGPTISLLIFGFIGMLMLVLLNLFSGQRAQIAFDNVNAAREIRSIAIALSTAMQAAESSQRGYLLSGNEIYLAPFETTYEEAARTIIALKLAVRDGNPPISNGVHS